MSTAGIIALVIGIAIVLAMVVFVTTARRSDVRGAGALSGETRKRDDAARRARQEAESAATRDLATVDAAAQPGTGLAKAPSAAPAPWTPPDPEAVGVSRRMFFNRASVSLTSAGVGAFAAAGFVAFLWPSATGGFGQVVSVGKLDEIRDGARGNAGFFYAPSARTWITEYPSDALPKAKTIYTDNIVQGMEQFGLVALYQKCPHLGCRVPECKTSRWFECPCHGSQYNQVGEKKGGPAPRGMDRFPIKVDAGGNVTVDTGTVVTGPAIGTNTTGQEAEGPHCITGGGEH
jgi:cytochrome b6-f complex iron-sulfur subunit